MAMESWKQRFARTAFARSTDTAHDLKTPLNIAVLNLELLRLRVQKITGDSDDPKLVEYLRVADGELRRLGAIFDAFFRVSVPPETEGPPEAVDLTPIFRQQLLSNALSLKVPDEPVLVVAHVSRIAELVRLLLEGTARILVPGETTLRVGLGEGTSVLTLEGPIQEGVAEIGKVFKFYYTDASGNPDLSLATARIIAETYGGTLTAFENADQAVIRLELPQGEK